MVSSDSNDEAVRDSTDDSYSIAYYEIKSR